MYIYLLCDCDKSIERVQCMIGAEMELNEMRGPFKPFTTFI